MPMPADLLLDFLWTDSYEVQYILTLGCPANVEPFVPKWLPKALNTLRSALGALCWRSFWDKRSLSVCGMAKAKKDGCQNQILGLLSEKGLNS